MALWRVRTTLPDQPGSLAVLAKNCGDAGVNILAIQVFPGLDQVTDEVVVRTPSGWGEAEVTWLVETSGGVATSCLPCSDEALADQPTRHLRAARTVSAQPATFPDVVARLLDAEAEPAEPGGLPMDVMDLQVGEVSVQIRRSAAFTTTEHARGAALAELVTDVLARASAPSALTPGPSRRVSSTVAPAYHAEGSAVAALVDGTTVGVAAMADDECEPGVREATLRVDPAWQRRGIGARLLREVARSAAEARTLELRFSTEADNQAVLPMVLAAGLRARIRMSGDRLTVQVPLRDLAPAPGVAWATSR